jgi:dihydrofolate reductase
MTIRAIMACDVNGGVAKNSTLPWPKSKEDFDIFRNYTLKQNVLIGSKTWFAPIFPKPLKDRYTIVLSSKDKIEHADFVTSGTPNHVINQIGNDFIVIGGADVFCQFFDHIQHLSLSMFNTDYDCDTFIPINDILYYFGVTRKTKYDNFTHYLFERT